MKARSGLTRSCVLFLGGATAMFLSGCIAERASYSDQRTFLTADDAVRALDEAAASGDMDRFQSIFGPASREVLSSGDPVADRHDREVFAIAMDQGWTLERVDSTTREFVVGHEEWAFPIPLVKDSRGWWFDTEAGKQEVLARRIGRNELAAIGVLRTYVFAQREYASRGHDGRPSGVFARQTRSDSGRRNGLYWEVRSLDETPSPLGELAAEAAKAGYTGDAQEGGRPFHGYFYGILESQGPAAPGGAMNYVVNGEMTRGFAMVAYPAEHIDSGVMTLIVGPDGVGYESDLGPDMPALAGSITTYNPDNSWSEVE